MRFLREATEIFIEWRKSGRSGLTNETFTACIQTITTLPKLAAHLMQSHGFNYVLSGKFMSDPIEGRFGWYRQVNGGNFFMSIKQLLEAEKKIRCLSLLQQNALTSAASLHVLDKDAVIERDAQTDEHKWLIEFLKQVSLNDMSDIEANVTYFVSGYIA